MPTNPLPEAACNMPVFVPKTERSIWCRLVYVTEAESRNQLHQELLLDGLRHRGLNEWADKIEAARAEYKAVGYCAVKVAVTVLMVVWVAIAALTGADIRRTASSAKTRRNETQETSFAV